MKKTESHEAAETPFPPAFLFPLYSEMDTDHNEHIIRDHLS